MGLMAMWTIMALQFEPGGLGADYQKLNMIQVMGYAHSNQAFKEAFAS